MAALSEYCIAYDELFRFESLVATLHISDGQSNNPATNNVSLPDEDGIWGARTAFMALVNALTNCPESLEDHTLLCKEFGWQGLNEVIVAAVSVGGTLNGHDSDMKYMSSIIPLVICMEPSLKPRKSHSDDYMTQKITENPSAVDQRPSPSPSYMDSSPVSFDYIVEQFGGGCRYKLPPAELTPSRLRTRLKDTEWDIGIVKDTSA
ncbi:uncharacterized protein EDB91DRAFT_1269367 [Suillus paluster]|uniref:uncharacterized protein n=1 Tax=Suillus paluster TaxID=48578 RepID=UPI001B869B9A|nr:uncharacterized protein EDB91DRAFT_1269367 [Suillus paluster]KAG1724160.1 hypothetical protein EDB91DRAFT_1269367 [Suillus paluster]